MPVSLSHGLRLGQFYFELAPGTTHETADQIRDVFSRWVTHLGVLVQQEANGTKEILQASKKSVP
jgi:hypothetical protein